MTIEQLGWNAHCTQQFAAYANSGLTPARVSAQHRELYRVFAAEGELVANISGRMRQFAEDGELPAVGDWVGVVAQSNEKRATIHRVVERRTKLARRAPGRGIGEQVLAANVDTLFIVTALDHDFSVPRIERYITMALEGGVEPVVVLSKADACADVSDRVNTVRQSCVNVPVHAISAIAGTGINAIESHLCAGNTVAMLGSSGAGKSTLLNALLGRDVQATAPVRAEDSKGRHTTTHRQLFVLAGGALLLDTPGLREVQLWGSHDSLCGSFAEIAELAAGCRFGDCRHQQEPGCAVIAATSSGRLEPARLESFRKQQEELEYLRRQTDVRAAQEHKRAVKAIHRLQKQFYRIE
jgi:ribosome biogenesis GTPase / thiamine phosphate phosphatase